MKKVKVMFVFTLALLFLAGCSKGEQKEEPGKTYVYYLNTEETKLIFDEYKIKSTSESDIVNELLTMLQGDPDDLSLRKAIPDNVSLPSVEFLGNNKIRLNFDTSYSKLSGVQELLSRAAIVKTLCQNDFITSVEFYVDENPLTDMDGQQVGALTDASFINSFNYTEKQNIILYYANQDKNMLKAVEAQANYDGATTLERIIIDQLIKGSDGIQNLEKYYGTIYDTIPDKSVCNSINTVDFICYVDMNSEFLDGVDGISDEVVIYSIVNSLTSLSTVNKVKFTIDGEPVSQYGSVSNFNQFFEMNYNLIEKTTDTLNKSTPTEEAEPSEDVASE